MSNLFINDTISPSENIEDVLAGGGTGLDLGNVVVSTYAPLVDQSANTGSKKIYLAHDFTNEITDLAVFISEFSQTYGGANTASSDFNFLKASGEASGNSKNNADGLSGGLWIDMDKDVDDSNNPENQFNIAAFPLVVKIFGDNGTDAIDFNSAFTIVSDAMIWDNSGSPATPSAPEDGKIGPAGNTVLGDNALIKFRHYFRESPPSGFPSFNPGVLQHDLTFSFSFTS